MNIKNRDARAIKGYNIRDPHSGNERFYSFEQIQNLDRKSPEWGLFQTGQAFPVYFDDQLPPRPEVFPNPKTDPMAMRQPDPFAVANNQYMQNAGQQGFPLYPTPPSDYENSINNVLKTSRGPGDAIPALGGLAKDNINYGVPVGEDNPNTFLNRTNWFDSTGQTPPSQAGPSFRQNTGFGMNQSGNGISNMSLMPQQNQQLPNVGGTNIGGGTQQGMTPYSPGNNQNMGLSFGKDLSQGIWNSGNKNFLSKLWEPANNKGALTSNLLGIGGVIGNALFSKPPSGESDKLLNDVTKSVTDSITDSGRQLKQQFRPEYYQRAKDINAIQAAGGAGRLPAGAVGNQIANTGYNHWRAYYDRLTPALDNTIKSTTKSVTDSLSNNLANNAYTRFMANQNKFNWKQGLIESGLSLAGNMLIPGGGFMTGAVGGLLSKLF
jgi:hypothetical protein